MTSVNMPRDDAALHTTKTASNRTVKETQPYPATPAVQAHEEATRAPRKNPQKSPQRRKFERRKDNLPVLLDTRSGHDRRNAIDSHSAESEDENSTNTGIDIYT
jgi:hypothetical protein